MCDIYKFLMKRVDIGQWEKWLDGIAVLSESYFCQKTLMIYLADELKLNGSTIGGHTAKSSRLNSLREYWILSQIAS